MPDNDLDSLLDQLDFADTAVRALYRTLADDPDLAAECETTLRELHGKRSELARRVGLAALLERRRGQKVDDEPTVALSEDEAVLVEQPVTVSTSELDDEAAAKVVEQPATCLVSVSEETASEVDSELAAAPPSAAPLAEVPVVPVSAERLREFIAAVTDPAPLPRPRPDDRSILLTLATHVAIAEEVSTLKVFEGEVEQLERAASEDRQKRWREMTREGQVRWLSLMVAWAKALDQEVQRFSESSHAISVVFRSLRSFSMYDAPGFVHGFARSASPRSASWRADALRLLREIRPVPEPVEVKVAAKVREPVVEAEPTPEALADWPLIDRVRGLRVVLLGGEPREERRVALERAFQFQSLEWIPRNRPRMVASLAERAAQRTIDFVLVTKFVAHKETEAIQRANGAPMLTMRRGYGVTAICQVFEDFFARGAEA